MEYVDSKEHPLIQIVRTHQHIIISALQTELQKRTWQIKDTIQEKKKESWQGKRVGGQFPRNLNEKFVDNNNHIDG